MLRRPEDGPRLWEWLQADLDVERGENFGLRAHFMPASGE